LISESDEKILLDSLTQERFQINEGIARSVLVPKCPYFNTSGAPGQRKMPTIEIEQQKILGHDEEIWNLK
jgi:hypothetical protein